VVAIGTKISANASLDANRGFGQIAREILAEAAEIDRREDELYGAERGDELPEHLRTREGRRKALREAKERLARERDRAPERPADDDAPLNIELAPQQFVTRPAPCLGARREPHAQGSARTRGAPDRQGPHGATV
jgi:hypothetical protein